MMAMSDSSPCIPSAGPCEMEKAIVASGGKGFRPLVDGFDQSTIQRDEPSANTGQSGTVIMWEAYEAKTIKQVKLLEENSPHFLDNHNSVCHMIHQGQFRDGTHIRNTPSGDLAEASTSYDHEDIAYTPDRDAQPLELKSVLQRQLDLRSTSASQPLIPEVHMYSTRIRI